MTQEHYAQNHFVFRIPGPHPIPPPVGLTLPPKVESRSASMVKSRASPKIAFRRLAESGVTYDMPLPVNPKIERESADA